VSIFTDFEVVSGGTAFVNRQRALTSNSDWELSKERIESGWRCWCWSVSRYAKRSFAPGGWVEFPCSGSKSRKKTSVRSKERPRRGLEGTELMHNVAVTAGVMRMHASSYTVSNAAVRQGIWMPVQL
jgi:hypothetical protein